MTALRRVREVPMSSSAYLRWLNRRRPTMCAPPTKAEAAAAIAKIQGRPYWRDRVEATGEGAGGDEMDAAYLHAIRMAPRVVGTADGQVHMAVTDRLYDAGLIRKVAR